MQIHRSDPVTAQDLAGSEKQKKTHASGERLQADKPSWIISDHFGAIYCSVSILLKSRVTIQKITASLVSSVIDFDSYPSFFTVPISKPYPSYPLVN